jgi:hypothetical protein
MYGTHQLLAGDGFVNLFGKNVSTLEKSTNALFAADKLFIWK